MYIMDFILFCMSAYFRDEKNMPFKSKDRKLVHCKQIFQEHSEELSPLKAVGQSSVWTGKRWSLAKGAKSQMVKHKYNKTNARISERLKP